MRYVVDVDRDTIISERWKIVFLPLNERFANSECVKKTRRLRDLFRRSYLFHLHEITIISTRGVTKEKERITMKSALSAERYERPGEILAGSS